MKELHRSDLYTWSEFNEERNIDFNSFLWVRPEGNILFDPLPLSEHDKSHLESLGGAKWIIVTNSDHIRDSKEIANFTGAKIAGPIKEKETFPIKCEKWLHSGDDSFSGLKVFELEGSKTEGELALILDDTILITGDLIRAHRAEKLMMLPEPKLKDSKMAKNSCKVFLDFPKIETILVGDGWHIFKDGYAKLNELF